MRQKQVMYAEMQRKRANYAAFEKTVLDLYNLERLSLAQLDHLANRYRWQKVDSAGSQHLLTRDGKDLYQVCIGLVDPSFPLPARGSKEDHEEYWEQELKKWEDIVRWRWGWQAYDVAIPRSGEQKKAA